MRTGQKWDMCCSSFVVFCGAVRPLRWDDRSLRIDLFELDWGWSDTTSMDGTHSVERWNLSSTNQRGKILEMFAMLISLVAGCV